MTHTPGPWHYDKDDKLNPDRAFGIVRFLGPQYDDEVGVIGATEVIAEVCTDDGSGSAEADARLMAAAPRIINSLKQLEGVLSLTCNFLSEINSRTPAVRKNHDLNAFIVHEIHPALTEARAAIAKATGQST